VLAAEHAAELELLDLARQRLHVGLEGSEGLLVVLGRGEFQQLGVVAERTLEAVQRVDDRRQRGALAPELLRALGVVPDLGFAQLELDFLEAVLLDGVVKDTP
jgi:hypothetical protein